MAVTQLCIHFGQEAVAGKEGTILYNVVEESLTGIVQLPLGNSHQFPVGGREEAVAYLWLPGVWMEWSTHV